ncbi:Actin, cytoplasmic [Tritrichomonas foetus]|uniref:Actin, cytoplasmic n=1 Tax=Tritrichomonas foetus TaxID=1144522 RepID=A0A1J4KRY7_9EUKA|nr:Actin, cytoplasmic [Tritrichomonas foetus]|eukprot:OHT12430.1 Actin, cytoplasmic [Tritrichomonas foetus]
MTEFEVRTIIIDNGSGTVRAGFAGQEGPSCVFKNMVGVAKYPVVISGGAHKDYYVSDEAFAKAGVLNLSHPVRHGIVKNWDHLELIVQHSLLNALKADPAEHPAFFVDAIDGVSYCREQREKIAQIMFEKFNTPSLYFQASDTLTLLSAGRTSGIVLDSGEGITSITAIFDDYKIPQSFQHNKIGGYTLTSYLMKKLNKDQILFHQPSERLIANEIKESMTYVAADYEAELQRSRTTDEVKRDFACPDGRVLKLNELRFKVPEFMFKPKIWGCEMKGVHQLIFDSIMKADVHCRRTLFENICIAGGNTMFEGFKERLQSEIQKLAPASINVKVYAPENRHNAAWIGASNLSALAQFPKMVITKSEYTEDGPQAITRKCP